MVKYVHLGDCIPLYYIESLVHQSQCPLFVLCALFRVSSHNI